MAGSFGYEAEHYELSKAIGRILFRQVETSDGDRVVAPGASCRSQLGDRPGAEQPPHPIERFEAAIAGGAGDASESPAAAADTDDARAAAGDDD